MTASLPIPTRLLALLGVVVLALGAFLVARPLLTKDDSTNTPTAYPSSPTTGTPTSPATPAKPAAPQVKLLANVPARVASKLMHSRVVVVSVYSGTSEGDRAALATAKAGAKEAGVGFAALNVLDEKQARELQEYAGSVSTPTMLVVRRPGRVITRLEGSPDAKLVAQAAHNARTQGK